VAITAVQFPRLYNLAFRKMLTIHDVKPDGWGVTRFRRLMYGETRAQWEELKRLVDEVQLNDQEDAVRWTIGSSGGYKVKYFILAIEVN
jgi:hypothetical protein